MVKDDPQFRIRLPAELKAHIEECARRNGRSLNSEIKTRLENSLGPIHTTSETDSIERITSALGMLDPKFLHNIEQIVLTAAELSASGKM